MYVCIYTAVTCRHVYECIHVCGNYIIFIASHELNFNFYYKILLFIHINSKESEYLKTASIIINILFIFCICQFYLGR